MTTPAIDVKDLVIRYSRGDAVKSLSLTVQPGTCHALFGRNGAGKTSTLRALLGLVPTDGGSVKLFGLDPRTHEAEVKSRIAWVPDSPGFHAWMSVREVLGYHAALRTRWDVEVEQQLLTRFELDRDAPAGTLSKGQKTQLALICAIAADPELLILDEPTSGLDPLVRRQFIEAVIGVFQERAPMKKTILLSTHLISEFEGVVDGFTVMNGGRAVLSTEADEARSRYRRLGAWFDGEAPERVPMKTVKPLSRDGRMVEFVVDADAAAAEGWLTQQGAVRVDASALSLEDIFLLAA
ncbi:MAG: ABC transporter ATP-binding protein [Archangium sp.]